MSIDFSKAPEGATHYNRESMEFYKATTLGSLM